MVSSWRQSNNSSEFHLLRSGDDLYECVLHISHHILTTHSIHSSRFVFCRNSEPVVDQMLKDALAMLEEPIRTKAIVSLLRKDPTYWFVLPEGSKGSDVLRSSCYRSWADLEVCPPVVAWRLPNWVCMDDDLMIFLKNRQEELYDKKAEDWSKQRIDTRIANLKFPHPITADDVRKHIKDNPGSVQLMPLEEYPNIVAEIIVDSPHNVVYLPLSVFENEKVLSQLLTKFEDKIASGKAFDYKCILSFRPFSLKLLSKNVTYLRGKKMGSLESFPVEERAETWMCRQWYESIMKWYESMEKPEIKLPIMHRILAGDFYETSPQERKGKSKALPHEIVSQIVAKWLAMKVKETRYC